MKDRTVAALFVAAVVAVFVLATPRPPPPSRPPDIPAGVAPTAAPRAEDAHVRLLRAVRSESKYAAEEIVSKRLKAPAQARFVTKELIETSENYALVYLEVDAPNSFGVRLRQNYCVVLHFDPPNGETFRWNTSTGVVGCEHGPPDEAGRYALKLANNWPDLGPPPASLAAQAEKPHRHRR